MEYKLEDAKNVRLPMEAHRRLKMLSGLTGKPMGKILAELIAQEYNDRKPEFENLKQNAK